MDPVQYSSAQGKALLELEVFQTAKAWWDGVLPEEAPRHDLAFGMRGVEGKRVIFSKELPEDVSAWITQISKGKGLSQFVLLLNAVGWVLGRYTHADGILVGSPTLAGAQLPYPNEWVGLSYVPVPDQGFKENLKLLAGKVVESYARQHYPWQVLLDARDWGKAEAFFDVCVRMEGVHGPMPTTEGIKLNFVAEGGGFRLELDAPVHFPQMGAVVGQLLEDVVMVLEKARQDDGDALSSYRKGAKHLAEGEGWMPFSASVLDLLDAQVEARPEAVAVEGDGWRLSYRELKEQGDRLAGLICQHGDERTPVVLLLERSPRVHVAIWACWRAGRAYVPVDPENPQERLRYVVEDTGTKLLIADEGLRGHAEGVGVEVMVWPDLKAGRVEEVDFPVLEGQDLAYIIYTSGSTGRPKGVMVSHENLAALMLSLREVYAFSSEDRVLSTASYAFDFSLHELFGPLCAGGQVIMVQKADLMDVAALMPELKRVTYVVMVAGMLGEVMRYVKDQGMEKELKGLRYFCTGAEAVAGPILEGLMELFPEAEVAEGYGPTEGTVVCTNGVFERGRPVNPRMIGWSMPHARVMVLGKDGQLAGPCEVGEICVGGSATTLGYLGRPELTEEKYILVADEGRVYRTGDLGRVMPDGCLEFLGRIDQQVKIRGYRVEPGEVEWRILEMEGVEAALVVAVGEDAAQQLAAYYILSSESLLDADGLKAGLAAVLPPYMVPSYWVQMEAFPTTISGKVDRKALPDPRKVAVQGAAAPRNELEEGLLGVFRQVLGMAEMGIHDRFFSLGGDSIKSIQAASRMRKLGYRLELNDLFRYPTVASLVPHLVPLHKKMEDVAVVGEVPLSPIQRVFFETYGLEGRHVNQAFMLHLPNGMKLDALRQALAGLVTVHDALRMVYAVKGGKIRQYNRGLDAGELYGLEEFEVRGDAAAEIPRLANQVQGSIDLENGPLLRAALFHAGDGDHLLLVVHHLVVDIVSWRILLEDMAEFYGQAAAGREIVLPERATSFQLWSQTLERLGGTYRLQKQKGYWASVLGGGAKVLGAEAGTYAEVESLEWELGVEATQALQRVRGPGWGLEITEILLLALGRALHAWRGGDAYRVELEGHGRESMDTGLDLNRTVGWFTAAYPFALPSAPLPLLEHAEQLRAAYRAIPERGIGYGILAWMGDAPLMEEGGDMAQADISYNYLGVQDGGDSGIGTGEYGFSAYSTGDSVAPHLKRRHALEVDGAINGGKLAMRFHYGRRAFEKGEMEGLVKVFGETVQQMVLEVPRMPLRGPSDVGMAGLGLEDWNKLLGQVPNGQAIEAVYPLSPMQEGMLFHAVRDSGDAYFEQSSYVVRGRFRPEDMEAAFQALVQRHKILRTNFYWEQLEAPLQVVFENRKAVFNYVDLRGKGGKAAVAAWMEEDRTQRFRLSTGALSRLAVLQVEEEVWGIVWSNHHILFDGWCVAILLGEFFQLLAGGDGQLPAPAPYHRYIEWLGGQDPELARAYWRDTLAGYGALTGLPRQKVVTGESYVAGEYSFWLSEEETRQLEQYAASEGVSVNQVMQTLWGIFLQHRNHSEDVVFGTVVAGRPSEVQDVETMVGLFVNTVPVRVDARGHASFRELLLAVKEQAGGRGSYEYLPLAEIQAQSPLGAALLDHLFVFENYPLETALAEQGGGDGGLEVEDVQVFEQTNYDLLVGVHPSHKTFKVQFSYNAAVYAGAVVEDAAQRYHDLLRRISQIGGMGLNEISLVDADEYKLLGKGGFNPLLRPLPSYKGLNEVFERRVIEHRERIAVVCGEERWTYGKLAEESGRRACYLSQVKGVVAGDVIGLSLHAQAELLAWIWACIRLRVVFTLLDPSLPLQRRQWIARDAGTRWVILHAEEEGWENGLVQDEVLGMAVGGMPSAMDWPLSELEDVVLIQYTSGSTGHPKGVALTQRNLLNFFGWYAEYLRLGPEDVFLQKTTIGFGDSWAELLLPTTFGGGACHLRPHDDLSKDLMGLAQWAATAGATVLQFVPAVWDTFSLVADLSSLDKMRVLVLSGGRVKQHYRYPFEVHDLYGNSECSAMSTAFRLSEDDERILIGKPIANTQIWLRGPRGQLMPPGYVGEMYIGGAGVGLGYLNLPELNAVAFVDDPWHEGEKLYRTGDMAVWTEDGNLDYRGRMDEQLKVRGQRVEAGEIEFQLMALHGVRRAVVMPMDVGRVDPVLVAWLEGDAVPEESMVKSLVGKLLPEHMVPDVIVAVDTFPLNANGKIDKQALPRPQLRQGEMEAAANEMEVAVLEVWRELLGGNFGVTDRFTDVGGHSLLAVRLVAAIHRRFGVLLPFNLVFQAATVREQAGLLVTMAEVREGDTGVMGQDVAVVNPEMEDKLFVFPPGIGYGLIFGELGKSLPELALYLFDFVEMGDPVHHYVEAIRHAQGEGPYWLMGYSAGGHLALRVAAQLEALGERVGAVVLFDSFHNAEAEAEDAVAEEEYVERYLREDVAEQNLKLLQHPGIAALVRNKVRAYLRWEKGHPDVGVVDAPIYLVQSENAHEMPEAKWQGWAGHTRGGFHLLKGWGNHHEMFEGAHRSRNAEIVRVILRDVDGR